MSRRTRVLLWALALDLLFGEPPTSLHPVVWFGRLVSALERRAPRGSATLEFIAGLGLTTLSVGTAILAGSVAPRLLEYLGDSPAPSPRPRVPASPRPLLPLPHSPTPPLLSTLAEACLLKSTLSARALFEAAAEVERALVANDLESARRALLSLVSRDTRDLDASLLTAAAIESVAENASDSVVAPALAYLAFGLPGALAYRAINTLDAMVGYRGSYEWLGKSTARLDDLANVIPARMTAALIALAALSGGNAAGAWRTALTDHARTASPNAGWPMSAMAGALGVELRKIGHYRLGRGYRAPRAADVAGAVALARTALGVGVLGLLVWEQAARVRRRAVSGP